MTARAHLDARYIGNGPSAPTQWNDTLSTLLSHHSVRAFRPDPIDDAIVTTLIAAAQSASTSDFRQAWSVILVRDVERKERLATLSGGQRSMRQAPLLMVWLADLHRMRAIATAMQRPHIALDYLESFLVGVIDAALAAQNVQVAARSLGLGSCFIGGMRNNPLEVSRELSLPASAVAVFGLVLGYADSDVPTGLKPRLPQGLVVHEEIYDAEVPMPDIRFYDEGVRAMHEGQGPLANGWIELLLHQISGPAAMHGRDSLKASLHRLGFPLL